MPHGIRDTPVEKPEWATEEPTHSEYCSDYWGTAEGGCLRKWTYRFYYQILTELILTKVQWLKRF